MIGLRVFEEEQTADGGRHPDGNIDEKDDLPAQPERMCRDEHPTEDLSDDVRESKRGAVKTQRLALLRVWEQHPDRCQHLWRHNSRGQSLENTAEDQDSRRPCHSAEN